MKYENSFSSANNVIWNNGSSALANGAWYGSSLSSAAYYGSCAMISCSTDMPLEMPYRYEITGDDIGASWTPRSARQEWVGRCLYCGVKRRDDERHCVACGAPS
jgi:hypothetical protein